MVKIIEFGTDIKFINLPKPARSYVPDWYKKSEKFVGGRHLLSPIMGLGSKTIKTCVPFLDAFTTGYIIELTQDVQVTHSPNGETILNWGVAENPIAEHRSFELMQQFPISEEFTKEAFAWKFDYYYKTPKGYSVLVTHPLNRYDLPFITLSGVVDSDNGITKGNLPFLIKKNFEGIIPSGTPIAQMLPFKRENWESKENKNLIYEGDKMNFLSRSTAIGWYKKTKWSRKDYS